MMSIYQNYKITNGANHLKSKSVLFYELNLYKESLRSFRWRARGQFRLRKKNNRRGETKMPKQKT